MHRPGRSPENADPDRITRGGPARRVLLVTLGLTAGFLSGFLGVGGGLLIVPGLMLAFHYPIKRAVGTSLATIVLVSLVGVVTESAVKGSNIRWEVGFVLTLGSLLGSWGAGARILPRLPDAPLRLGFAGVLLVASYRMAVAAQAGDGTGLPLAPAGGALGGYPLALAAGGVAGASSVLFGIGGGIITVPALSLLFPEFPFHAARATSLVTIVPTSGFGAYQHGRLGTVDVAAALQLIPGGIAGAVLGVVSVNLLPADPCRLAFATFLVLTAARALALKRGPGAPPTLSSLRVGLSLPSHSAR